MTRGSPWKRKLRSQAGLKVKTFRPRDPASEFEAVRSYWEHDAVRSICAELDERAKGNARAFRPSQHFALYLLALRLKADVKTAHTIIETSPQFRELFALPRIPERQSYCDFLHRWLPSQFESCEFIGVPAYNLIPAAAIAKFDLDTMKIAVDGMGLQSVNKSDIADRARPDEGARWIVKGDEQFWGRRKVSAVLAGDAPLVIASHIGSEHELTLIRECITDIAAASEFVAERAAAVLARPHPGYAGAAICIDNIANGNAMAESIYESDFVPVLQEPAADKTTIVGEVHARQTSNGGSTATFALRRDGAFLCPCDVKEDDHLRTPMRRLSHGSGQAGGIYIECANPADPRAGQRFHVAFRAKVFPRDSPRASTWRRQMHLTTAVARHDERSVALHHKAGQVVEGYHKDLSEKFWLGKADRRKLRRFRGSFAYDFYYSLGDLLWNLEVVENLTLRGVGDELPWKAVAAKGRANSTNIVSIASDRDEKRERRRASAEARRSRSAMGSGRASAASPDR